MSRKPMHRPVLKILLALTVVGLLILLSGDFRIDRLEAATADTWVTGGTIGDGKGQRTRNGQSEKHAGIDIGKKGVNGKWQSGVSVKAGCTGDVAKVYPADEIKVANTNY